MPGGSDSFCGRLTGFCKSGHISIAKTMTAIVEL